jgi:sigma-54 dependent transcriptional regulator, flagellar regulatory protein
LRVLQERCFEPLGGSRAIHFDVRVIVATHRNLPEMIAEGSFREELYNHLSLFTINLPSLKERAEDIPLLINELVVRLESEQCASVRFNSAAIMSLCQHDWQGNTRELASLVERLAVTHPYGLVGVQDLPPNYRHVDEDESESVSVDAVVSRGRYASVENTPLLPEQGIDMRKYMANLAQGDFGMTFHGRPVADIMAQRFPVTIRLTFVALIGAAPSAPSASPEPGR